MATQARIQDSEGGGAYRNFRSGSKLLQGPGQIDKQNKIADSRRGGGGVRSPQKNPVSAHATLPMFVMSTDFGLIQGGASIAGHVKNEATHMYTLYSRP